jgi:arginine decarboxylase
MLIERSQALGIPSPHWRKRSSSPADPGAIGRTAGATTASFGLTSTEIIEIVDELASVGMLDCLKLVHYHLGSQIPNIRDIRTAVQETARFYAELYREGAALEYLDLGGGLAVDYDGSQTNYVHSKNYTIKNTARTSSKS